MLESKQSGLYRYAMSSRGRSAEDTVRQRSGWLIPLAVFVVTAGLSGAFLVYYLAPTPTYLIEEHQSPTSRTDRVRVTVGDLSFAIPANYLLYPNARQGGERKHVELFAGFPDFRGYSDRDSQVFSGNGADSPVIYMQIRNDPFNLGEAERLKRIYMVYVTDPAGKAGPFGLTAFAFRDDTGYRHEDLFVGDVKGRPVVMRCVRFGPDVPSPSCLRDVKLSNTVVLSYRFKRARLANWHDIADGVSALVRSFGDAAK